MTVNDVKRLSGQLGATVEDVEAGHHRTLRVDLPPGKIFNANGEHSLTTSWDLRGGKAWCEPAIEDILDRMGLGVDDNDCGDDCDICHP